MNARDMMAFTMGAKAGAQQGYGVGHQAATEHLGLALVEAAKELGLEDELKRLTDRAYELQLAECKKLIAAAQAARAKGGK